MDYDSFFVRSEVAMLDSRPEVVYPSQSTALAASHQAYSFQEQSKTCRIIMFNLLKREDRVSMMLAKEPLKSDNMVYMMVELAMVWTFQLMRTNQDKKPEKLSKHYQCLWELISSFQAHAPGYKRPR